MPQSTLRGYFTPIQTKPVSTASPVLLQVQVATDSPSGFDDAGRNTASHNNKDGDSPDSNVAVSIREMIEPNVFGNVSLDVFVPPGQPHAAIVKVLPSYIPRLKNITSTLLPVRYSDKFFQECLVDEMVADLSRVLMWDSQPVGWIRCRLEDNDATGKQVYVQALGILAPYRGLGLAKSLLDQVTRPEIVQKNSINSMYCHVWESNEDAIRWYEKRGFNRVIMIEQYYKRLKPAGAWIMRKDLT